MLILDIVYALSHWVINIGKYLIINNFLFGKVIWARNTIRIEFIYYGQKIAFDGSSSWRFGDGFPQNEILG